MKYIVVIKPKLDLPTKSLVEEVKTVFGKVKIDSIFLHKIYSFSGNIKLNDVKYVVKTLLVDTVVENFEIYSKAKKVKDKTVVNIWYKPEVLDVESMYVKKAMKYINSDEQVELHSGKQVVLIPKLNNDIVKAVIEKIFMNPLIQYYEIV